MIRKKSNKVSVSGYNPVQKEIRLILQAMNKIFIIIIILLYFSMLIGVSFLTSRKADNSSFFLGNKKSPWYLVAFGMIGASLSGVTFLSIPGWVGNPANQFSYMQAVLGYFFGYLIISFVLLPIYYRMNLTSIYEYLKDRFGNWSYKTGASFFLLSRMIGSSIRLLLVANVLQSLLFDSWGVPFEVSVLVTVLLIWIYTFRGGIKTIVWTDTIQTVFMLASVILTVYFISGELGLHEQTGVIEAVSSSSYSRIFFFDDFNSNNHFLKHFFGGMFITLGMTGLDQDMMQKNLSCRTMRDAQKNMISLASVLIIVNLLFLSLGALLYLYAGENGIQAERSDLLFSEIAMSEAAGPVIGILFLLGLIAAAYSSADSALTALTTSFSIDFLTIGSKPHDVAERIRKRVHIGMSVATVLVIIALKYVSDDSAIDLVMRFAGFTYGPLIGLFFFGIISRRKVRDQLVPFMSILSILLTFFLWYYSAGAPGVAKGTPGIFGNYVFGYELIILNSCIMFSGLFLSTIFVRQKAL